MKISELFKQNKLVASAEVFPPKKSESMELVVKALKGIKHLEPDFVSVTCGAGGNGGTSTFDVATVVSNAFSMNAVAHMTCVGITYEAVDAKLLEYKRNGIQNILALRGDKTDESQFYDFNYASDLIAYIKKTDPSFGITGGCYPEKHTECISLEQDVDNLKTKVDSGCETLISQLFFDNDKFFAFMDMLDKKGINIPVQAGIMPITSAKQLPRMTKMCGASIPKQVNDLIEKYDGESLIAAGIDFSKQQIETLVSQGVKGLHIYTMNKPEIANEIFAFLTRWR